jgi:hypothetical protein
MSCPPKRKEIVQDGNAGYDGGALRCTEESARSLDKIVVMDNRSSRIISECAV